MQSCNKRNPCYLCGIIFSTKQNRIPAMLPYKIVKIDATNWKRPSWEQQVTMAPCRARRIAMKTAAWSSTTIASAPITRKSTPSAKRRSMASAFPAERHTSRTCLARTAPRHWSPPESNGSSSFRTTTTRWRSCSSMTQASFSTVFPCPKQKSTTIWRPSAPPAVLKGMMKTERNLKSLEV